MVELADTLDLGSSGQPCRFKSCYPHHVRRTQLRSVSAVCLEPRKLHIRCVLLPFKIKTARPLHASCKLRHAAVLGFDFGFPGADSSCARKGLPCGSSFLLPRLRRGKIRFARFGERVIPPLSRSPHANLCPDPPDAIFRRTIRRTQLRSVSAVCLEPRKLHIRCVLLPFKIKTARPLHASCKLRHAAVLGFDFGFPGADSIYTQNRSGASYPRSCSLSSSMLFSA